MSDNLTLTGKISRLGGGDLDIIRNDVSEVNAELANICIGYDGTTYATAGEAVRLQIGNLKDNLNKFYSVEFGKNLFDSSTFEINKTLNYIGKKVDVDGYGLSDFISVKNGETIYFSYNSVLNEPTYLFTFRDKEVFKERLSGSQYTSYTIPSDVTYIRFTITNGRVPLYMVATESGLQYETYRKETKLSADNIQSIENNIIDFSIRISALENAENKDVLFGKTLCVCGDSLTYGAYADSDQDGNRKTYAYYTAKRNNMILTVNAVSGSSITTFKEGETGGGASFTYGSEGKYARYKRLNPNGETLDYITIWFGLNDYTYLSKTNGIGTINDTDPTTFYGAWNTVMQYLISHYPTAKIGIVVTYGASKEIRDATRAICRKYGIPPLDFMGDSKIPIMTDHGRDNGDVLDTSILSVRKNTFITSADHVHMIDAGYKYFSTIFENYLRSL